MAWNSFNPLSRDGSWHVEPEQSSVRFSQRHFWGLVPVRGRFTVVRGEADVADGVVTRGSVHIETSSVDTRHRRRDKHLRSADLLDAARHPAIVFTVGSAATRSDDGIDIEGALTVRGTTHRIAFTGRLATTSEDAVLVRARAAVDRAAFGIIHNPVGMMRGPTRIDIALLFRRSTLSTGSGTGQGG